MKPPPPELLPPDIIELISDSLAEFRKTGEWRDARPLVIKAGLLDQDPHEQLKPYEDYVYITDGPSGRQHVKCTLAGVLATASGRQLLDPLPRLFAHLAERFLSAYEQEHAAEPEFPLSELGQFWPDAGDRRAALVFLEHFGLHAISSATTPNGPYVWRLSYGALHLGHVRNLDDALKATELRAFNDIPAEVRSLVLPEVWGRMLSSGEPARVTDVVVTLDKHADVGPYMYPLRDVGLLRVDKDHRFWLSFEGWRTLASAQEQADLLKVVRVMAAHRAATEQPVTFARLASPTELTQQVINGMASTSQNCGLHVILVVIVDQANATSVVTRRLRGCGSAHLVTGVIEHGLFKPVTGMDALDPAWSGGWHL